MTKSNLREKGLFHLAFYSPSQEKARAGPQGSNLGTGTEAETREESCVLACSSWLAHYACLYAPGPPAGGCYHPQWSESAYIHHQSRKCPVDWPTGQPDGAFS